MPNQQDLKKRMYNMYNLNKNGRDLFIKNHFVTEGLTEQPKNDISVHK